MRSREIGISTFVIIFIVLFAAGVVALVNRPEQNQFKAGVGGGPEAVTESVTTIQQRKQIHEILQEHISLGSVHLQNLYDGKDTTDSTILMDRNTNDLIDLVANISGNRNLIVHENFKKSWIMHMDLYEDYALALKDQDQARADQARQSLDDLATGFGAAAAAALPNVSANEAEVAMREHIALTLSVIDAYAKNDEDSKINQLAKDTIQASRFSEILVP